MFTSGYRPWIKNVACLSSLILFGEQVKNNFAAVGSCGPSTQIEIATEYKQLQNIESIKDLVE